MHLSHAAKQFWLFIADFGDIAVILPAYLAIALILVLHKRQRDAIVWGVGLLVCATIAALLKIEIGAFQVTLFGHTFHAGSFPSGHSSLSIVFYGGLAVLIGYGASSPLGRVAAAGLLALALLIAIAVWVLWWHPMLDVMCGLALGSLCLVPLTRIAMARVRPWREVAAMLAATVLLVSLMHGTQVDDRALQAIISMRSIFLPHG
jgi:membrane-associated phospholipid phosphatase